MISYVKIFNPFTYMQKQIPKIELPSAKEEIKCHSKADRIDDE